MFEKAEPVFRDVQAYLLSLRPPKYPFDIDAAKAKKGQAIFKENCARCHGTYGEAWTYPNKIIPIEEIGTDRTRYDGVSAKFGTYYNKSWFAKEKAGWVGDEFIVAPSVGYQAPPLDGIWATAPYLHNGSVPTLRDLLKPEAQRPAVFYRGNDVYDERNVGFVSTEAKRGDKSFYKFDTHDRGNGNGGHVYGIDLSDADRDALLEYLKTL